jgi:outer membrane receptor protein involved in Fe transport
MPSLFLLNSARCFRLVAQFFSLCVLSASAALAAPAAKAFDLPADAAEVSLKKFSVQSGLEVLFVTEVAANVRTNAVKGSYAPREAMDLMLAGTPLVATQDPRTGALKVSRTPSVTPSERPAPNVARAPAIPTPDETLVLSPFVVDAARESGYQATTTLAGNRIRTPIEDIGAAVSIYTKDFLNDISATTTNELLIYATGMETAGSQGTFSNGVGNDVSSTFALTEGTRTQPQISRTRGLAGPQYTRGYFSSNIPIDGYNTDGVTVSRGPNAILFGAGSPAGVVDTQLAQADLRRNKNRVETRFGDNGAFRASIDLNRVIVPNLVALRIAAVDDDEKFDQRPAYEHKRRIYGALTVKPFRSSTFRGNFESGNTKANRPITVLPVNGDSYQWRAAGQPTFDFGFFDDPTRNPSALAQTGTSGQLQAQPQIFDQIAVIWSSPNAARPDISFRATTPNTTAAALAVNSIRNHLFHPLVNRDLGQDVLAYWGTVNIGLIAGSYWQAGADAVANQLGVPVSKLPTGGIWPAGVSPAGVKRQGFVNYDAFDWRRQMIDESGAQGDDFNTFNLAFEQLAWRDRVGIELAYNSEKTHRQNRNNFYQTANSNFVYIDTTVVLPSGQPNPNLGRPFSVGRASAFTDFFNRREGMRATAFAKYDFKELGPKWTRWLGRHTLTGLWQRDAEEGMSYSRRPAAFGALADAIGGPQFDNGNRIPGLVVYHGPSVLGNKPLKLEPIRIAPITGPLSFPTTYFAAPAGSAAQGDFTTSTTTLDFIAGSVSAQREILRSEAVALQSYWLADHLVTLAGWRRDRNYLAQQIVTVAQNNNPATFKNYFTPEDFSFPSTPPFRIGKEVKSYSAVLKWPQRLMRLPWGANASIFYSNSENFTPAGTRVDTYGRSLAPPTGETKEYGFNLSLLNNRFQMRLNRFETAVSGQAIAQNAGSTLRINGVLQRTGFWATEQNINPNINRSADIEAVFAVLPANFRQTYGWTVSGNAPTLNHTFVSQLPGFTDTTDFVAKGTEIEMTFQPNSHWRFLANFAQAETVQNNIGPDMKEFIERVRPVFTQQLAGVPGANYPAGWVIGGDNSRLTPPQTLSQWWDINVEAPYRTTLANEGAASAEQRKYRANLVGNYSFGKEGWLKGWNVGTGLRWQSKIGLGYPVRRVPAANVPTGVIDVDLKHPYYNPAETNVDVFAGYTRKLWRDKIEWKVQLNVRNVIGTTDLIAVTVQPWGDPAVTRIPPEKRWYVTNTFSF